MSGFQLKLLAAAAMLCDHIGYLFFPEFPIFRLIGRIAFPIFCFLISEGCAFTSHIGQYLRRLFCFALLSEIPYDLVVSGEAVNWRSQNTMFTLLLGAFCCWMIKYYFRARPVRTVLAVGALAFAAGPLRFDYGSFGVLLVIAFYLFRSSRRNAFLCFAGLNLAFSSIRLLVPASPWKVHLLEPFALAACLPLTVYNGERGRFTWKWFFYLFYPLHLLSLYGLSLLI